MTRPWFTIARMGRVYWILCGTRTRWATSLPEAFAIAAGLSAASR